MSRAERARAGFLVLLTLAACDAANSEANTGSDAGRDGGTPPVSTRQDSGANPADRDSGSADTKTPAERDAATDSGSDRRADAGSRLDSGADASTSTGVEGERGPEGLIVANLVSGRGYSCGSTTAGKVLCWGDGSYGSLGTGVYSDTQWAPVAVEALGFPGVTVKLAAAGFNTCAIDEKKVLRCCGHTTAGVLPTGSDNSNVLGPTGPIQIPNAPQRIRAVGLGYDRNGIYVDDVDGTASYWSSDGVIVKLDDLGGLKSVSAGGEHWCGLTNDNGVKCWGRTAFGALGDGQDHINEAHVQTPTNVVGLASGVKSLAYGFNHACVLTESGGVKCWGIKGVLGTGAESNIPVDVPGLTSGVLALSGSHRHTCALTETNLICWGWNFNKQLGVEQGSETPGTVDVPTTVPGMQADTILAISTGYSHTCVSLKTGGVKCWGQNHILGIAAGNTATPTAIKGL